MEGKMITINVDKLVGGNIAITTSGGSLGGGYDVTFATGTVSSGEYEGLQAYWGYDEEAEIEVFFSDGTFRYLEESDFGSTLHNVIGFSQAGYGYGSSWYWVDSQSNEIPFNYNYEPEYGEPMCELTGNAIIYGIGV